MEHPLPNGTKVRADISCKHCNIGSEPVPDDIRIVTILNHSVQDGMIRYKATGLPISQHLLVEHIKEVISE